jgi:tetratricopeptide (TPR) repeat protein
MATIPKPQNLQPISVRQINLTIIAVGIALIFAVYLTRDETKKAVPQCATSDVCRDLATASFRNGEFPIAQALLQKALSLNPEDWQAHAQLGEVHKQAGDYIEAIRHYEAARKILGTNQVDPKVWRPLCEIYEYEHRPDEAWIIFQELYHGHEPRVGETYPMAGMYFFGNGTREDYANGLKNRVFYITPSIQGRLDTIRKDCELEHYEKVIGMVDAYLTKNPGSAYTMSFLRYKIEALFALNRYQAIVGILKGFNFAQPSQKDARLLVEDLYAQSLERIKEGRTHDTVWKKIGLDIDKYAAAGYSVLQRIDLTVLGQYAGPVPIEDLREELENARILYANGSLGKALQKLENFDNTDKGDEVLRLYLRGGTYFQIGWDARAVKDLEKICASYPNHPLAFHAHIQLNAFYLSERRYAESYKHLKAILPVWKRLILLACVVCLQALMFAALVFFLHSIFFKRQRAVVKDNGMRLEHLIVLLSLAFFLKPALTLIFMAAQYYAADDVLVRHIQPMLTAELLTETAMLGWVAFLVLKVYRWDLSVLGVRIDGKFGAVMFEGFKILFFMLGATTIIINVLKNGLVPNVHLTFDGVGAAIYYAPLSDRWQFFTIFMLFVVISPLVDELVFRGFLVRFLGTYLNSIWASCFSAYIFAAYYAQPLILWLVFLLNGVILSEYYRRRNQIAPLVIAHALYNFAILMFIYKKMAFVTSGPG